MGVQSAFLLGAAYEDEGRFEEAERTYMAIANRADLNFQLRDALAHAARLRRRMGNLAGAAELYEEVLTILQDGADRSVFELRLAEVRAEMTD